MKCTEISLKLNTINIGCNTHEVLGVVLPQYLMCIKTPKHITHVSTSYSTIFTLNSHYKFKQSNGFDTQPLLVIVVPGTDRFAITSDDWSGGTSASKKFVVGASVLNAFDYFYPFLYKFVPYMNVVQFLREQLHSVGIQRPILCRNCEG